MGGDKMPLMLEEKDKKYIEGLKRNMWSMWCAALLLMVGLAMLFLGIKTLYLPYKIETNVKNMEAIKKSLPLPSEIRTPLEIKLLRAVIGELRLNKELSDLFFAFVRSAVIFVVGIAIFCYGMFLLMSGLQMKEQYKIFKKYFEI